MGPEILSLLIPVVAIIGGLSIGALKVWAAHKEKLEQMKYERMERQAQIDRELLGLGGTTSTLTDATTSAHLGAILDRLNAIETRIGAREPHPTPQVPAPRTIPPITDEQPADRREQLRTDAELQ